MSTRPAAVAGSFYPLDREELSNSVDEFLRAAKVEFQANDTNSSPRAIISPHAGYIYSGPIAGSAFKTIAGKNKIKRVLLMGPAHRVAFRGIAAVSSEAFQTPLGKILVDTDSIEVLKKFPQIIVYDEAHKLEHSLEVQIPFIQRIFPEALLIPLCVGMAHPQEIAEILEVYWNDPETMIVVSSDLSHYLPYREAQSHDQKTSEHIQNLDYEKIDFEDACGALPVKGLLSIARKYRAKVKILDLRNSGDTAGEKTEVVGYGAYGIYV